MTNDTLEANYTKKYTQYFINEASKRVLGKEIKNQRIDTQMMFKILKVLGATVEKNNNKIILQNKK